VCGIVGFASCGAVPISGPLEEMRDTLRHRGPDDEGIWHSADARVALAHRRLAVIDLTPGGHQPMTDRSGTLQVVFNGEIYNYRALRGSLQASGTAFGTASDTEVILEAYRAWGPACLARLDGMFSFALYDGARRRLLLARDRAGEKPLYYRIDASGIRFASELKALLADPSCPRVLDLDALNHYLAYAYVPADGCMLQGVRKLPAGHALSFDLDSGTSELWRYWGLPARDESKASPERLTDRLEMLLSESVQSCLVADVPVGILLSGGLDSSLVTALAARVSAQPVKTFTITFPGQQRFDESLHAKLIAHHFGTDHTEMAAEDLGPEILGQLAIQFDEPMGDSSMVPTYLVSRLVRQHATVALGGDGGDELFGGYRYYNWIQGVERLRQILPSSVRHLLHRAGARLPVGVRGRHYLMGLNGGGASSIAHLDLYLDAATRAQLLGPRLAAQVDLDAPERHKAASGAGGISVLQQATVSDFTNYLTDDILVKVDRASMLASLEVRAPFLNHRLVEFAFSEVPDRLKATATGRKILLKQLGQRLLPVGFDLSRKQGFSIPLAAWLRGPWGDYVYRVLNESESPLFDRAVVSRLIEGQRNGRDNSKRLFALAMFELWRRHYDVRVPA
jgi:asparagine synthase (glutamine-hydrolysing)